MRCAHPSSSIWASPPQTYACFTLRVCANPSTQISASRDRRKSALLGGNVNLADLSLTPAFDLGNFIDQFTGGVETPPSQGFTQNVALNLAVHSSNNVNLVSRTLSVGGSANLQVRGTVAEPVILGRANLTGGDIILQRKPLRAHRWHYSVR